MKIIDSHCDVLGKLYLHRGWSFTDNHEQAHVSLPRLQQAGVAVQFFAMYLSEGEDFAKMLEYVDIFKSKIAVLPEIKNILTKQDLREAYDEGKIGALLTIEGVDALAGNLTYLRILSYLGVRSVGITWNNANWAADGIREPRAGGFTALGRKLVRECESLGLLIDVSHLSDAGFWELSEIYSKPFIASHSNARRICPDTRNLTDEQIQALAGRGGMMALNFVPWFIKESEPRISDVLRHLDHFCSLGATKHVGIGSDFDGIPECIPGLEHTGCYENLANELYKRYKPEEAEGFLHQNWFRFLSENLPDEK